MDNFKVKERTESSHLSVRMSVQCLLRSSEYTVKRSLKNVLRFYKFDNVTLVQYRENLKKNVNSEFIHNFIIMKQYNSMSISVLAENCLDILYKYGS